MTAAIRSSSKSGERNPGRGRRVRRLVDGLPEWRLAGLPVAAGQN